MGENRDCSDLLRKAVAYKKYYAFWWGQMGFEYRTLIFCYVEPKSPLKDLVAHVIASKLTPVMGQEGVEV